MRVAIRQKTARDEVGKVTAYTGLYPIVSFFSLAKDRK